VPLLLGGIDIPSFKNVTNLLMLVSAKLVVTGKRQSMHSSEIWLCAAPENSVTRWVQELHFHV